MLSIDWYWLCMDALNIIKTAMLYFKTNAPRLQFSVIYVSIFKKSLHVSCNLLLIFSVSGTDSFLSFLDHFASFFLPSELIHISIFSPHSFKTMWVSVERHHYLNPKPIKFLILCPSQLNFTTDPFSGFSKAHPSSPNLSWHQRILHLCFLVPSSYFIILEK